MLQLLIGIDISTIPYRKFNITFTIIIFVIPHSELCISKSFFNRIRPLIILLLKKCVNRSRRTKNANLDSRQTNFKYDRFPHTIIVCKRVHLPLCRKIHNHTFIKFVWHTYCINLNLLFQVLAY